MPAWLMQVTGLFVLVLPLVVLQWDMDRRGPRRSRHRWLWHLELYSNQDDITGVLVDEADVPFPVRQVRTSKGEQARFSPGTAWARPRIELDVDVAHPFTDEALRGLLGHDHQLQFVSGNEAVIDTNQGRIRIRAYRSP